MQGLLPRRRAVPSSCVVCSVDDALLQEETFYLFTYFWVTCPVGTCGSDPIKQSFTCDRVLAQTKGQLCVTKEMSAFYLVCDEVMR